MLRVDNQLENWSADQPAKQPDGGRRLAEKVSLGLCVWGAPDVRSSLVCILTLG